MDKIILESLKLTNFATFKHSEINFHQKFNGIIGETGSGKSLLLDALQFILGHRADKKFIRKGCDFSIIEATYSTNSQEIRDYFNELGFPFEADDSITVKRVLYSNGKSKCYLNLQTCNLGTIQEISKRFIDLVGQFENQKLMSSKYQMILLDKYCEIESDREEYFINYNRLKDLKLQLEELKNSENQKQQRLDFLQFQIKEIDSLNPTIEEEEELIEKKNRLLKSKDFKEAKQQILSLLSEGENNCLGQASYMRKILTEFSDLFPANIQESCDSAIHSLEELSYEISALENTEEDQSLDSIITKLDQYQKLKRKFGGSTDSIIRAYDEYKSEFDQMKNSEFEIKKLEQEIQALKETCHQQAAKLHATRVQNGTKLSKALTKIVNSLNMPRAKIWFELHEKYELDAFGATDLNLFSQLNPGEGLHPIKDIASGGELSRILLALRQVMASKDSISIFLFDEIDTGIGGETAIKIANVLKEVSLNSQVVAITHLPQIAIKADELIVVEKNHVKDRTESSIKLVIGKEIAKHAREMASLGQ